MFPCKFRLLVLCSQYQFLRLCFQPWTLQPLMGFAFIYISRVTFECTLCKDFCSQHIFLLFEIFKFFEFCIKVNFIFTGKMCFKFAETTCFFFSLFLKNNLKLISHSMQRFKICFTNQWNQSVLKLYININELHIQKIQFSTRVSVIITCIITQAKIILKPMVNGLFIPEYVSIKTI